MPETMSKSFIFCVHAHQPVGNFDSVFSEAFERSYKPFFEVLDRHPRFTFACHLSGSLIDWLESHQAGFVRLLGRMAGRGQIEFLGGGYYEPIYGMIPKQDLAGQIAKMSKKTQALFGNAPQGAWLTERVWDPELVPGLAEAGVRYTILDDHHFEKAGKTLPVTGYYRTGGAEKGIDLFASMKQLRYLMPFRKAEETLDFIRSSSAAPGDVLVFADDCEKFGMWPGTFDWVYSQGWLDHFLTLVEKDDTIRLYTFSQFRDRFKPKGSVRIPHASYSEMMEWSGGRFYNFLNKYAESRYMRDRMWQVSADLQKAISRNGSAPAAGKILAQKATENLYKAQCNCSYWHGVFGGLYLHHLRSAVFENLIQADSRIHAGARKKTAPEFRRVALGSGERWELRQKDIVSFFNPRYGGSLEELDFIPISTNLMCNLQRLEEPYHETVLKKKPSSTLTHEPLSIHEILGSKESNLERYLRYDPYRRLSFMDHVFEAPITSLQFSECSYEDKAGFVNAPFKARVRPGRSGKKLVFERKDPVKTSFGRQVLWLKKTVTPEGGNSMTVCYELTNQSAHPLRFTFATEFNFSIGDDFAMKGISEPSVKEWVFKDSWRGITVRLTARDEVTLLAVPIETVSESELGLERTYQELAVLMQRNFDLKPGRSMEHKISLTVDGGSV